MTTWDPDAYAAFKEHRDRPALDLMLQIPADLEPRVIWDLGCGAGEHAALLAMRHPGAKVHGLDSSAPMLEVARARRTSAEFVLGDIAAFDPPTPPDLIFANASLQWVDGHLDLFPRLMGMLTKGGVFACQVPLTFDQPWHRRLRALAREEPFRPLLGKVRAFRPVLSAQQYYGLLSRLGEADVWSTTYLHPLRGADPVTAWMAGTGMRPYLDRLTDPALKEAFLERYSQGVRRDLPPGDDGVTLFPFPRLFMVARRR